MFWLMMPSNDVTIEQALNKERMIAPIVATSPETEDFPQEPPTRYYSHVQENNKAPVGRFSGFMYTSGGDPVRVTFENRAQFLGSAGAVIFFSSPVSCYAPLQFTELSSEGVRIFEDIYAWGITGMPVHGLPKRRCAHRGKNRLELQESATGELLVKYYTPKGKILKKDEYHIHSITMKKEW